MHTGVAVIYARISADPGAATRMHIAFLLVQNRMMSFETCSLSKHSDVIVPFFLSLSIRIKQGWIDNLPAERHTVASLITVALLQVKGTI